MTIEERIKQQRDQRLIELGYCHREFRPDEEIDENDYTPTNKEYPFWDEEKHCAYRLVADEVTDEQFQQIITIGGSRVVESSNTLAAVLTFLAWVGCIIFVLAGIILGKETGYRSSFNFSVFAGFCGGGVGCMLSLLWFAEVIKLLQRIHDKL